MRPRSRPISGVLPSITCSFTPLTDAAGLRRHTCRSSIRSKNPRNADRFRFRLAGDRPEGHGVIDQKTAMWELAGRRIKTYLRTANTRHEARGVLFTSRCIGVGFSDRPEDR